MKTALIYPPTCDPTAPYLAVPTLSGWLRAHGHEVLPIDANLEGWEHLLDERELRRLGARVRERRLELTRTEFQLLELFLRNPRQVLTRSLIYERVWGYDFGFGSNSLHVYVGYLRRKLEADGEPRLLQTVRGVGYALREEP